MKSILDQWSSHWAAFDFHNETVTHLSQNLRFRYAGIAWLVLSLFNASPGDTAELQATGDSTGYMGFIPFVREHPCIPGRYRQLAVSLPLQGMSDGREGHPWRAMYGLCVAQKGRLSLHQDWVISYLDVRPIGAAPGGDGVAFGTDFSMQWRHDWGVSFAPYYELGGGIQYAAVTPFPAHGSRWTFTINVGVGFLISVTQKLEINTALRYLHMSNANVISKNAGYDAYHLVIGVRWMP